MVEAENLLRNSCTLATINVPLKLMVWGNLLRYPQPLDIRQLINDYLSRKYEECVHLTLNCVCFFMCKYMLLCICCTLVTSNNFPFWLKRVLRS